MTDVSAGGYTVFPEIGIKLVPKKVSEWHGTGSITYVQVMYIFLAYARRSLLNFGIRFWVPTKFGLSFNVLVHDDLFLSVHTSTC